MKRLIVIAAALAALPAATTAAARRQSPDSAPALADPAGITTTVTVTTVAQLTSALSSLASNTKISIAAGTYNLTSTLIVNGGVTNCIIRGATGNRNDVILKGPGMADSSVSHGISFWNCSSIWLADLTIGSVYYHPIDIQNQYGAETIHLYNVRAYDGGQQLLKCNPNGAGGGCDNGTVEYCVFDYTTTAPSDYTNGVDVHTGANWKIRHCLFKNIRAPTGSPIAGPSILMWNKSSNTIAEGNLFLNCERGISFGLNDAVANDHTGGIIRSNIFYRSASQSGDVAIYLCNSPNTQILNNTCILSGSYSNNTPIEYRWTNTTGTLISNNLLDGTIWARDGATGTTQTNLTNATTAMFVNAAGSDFHLVAGATTAINTGTTLTNCVDDWDAGARPSGAAYDIGADEYGSVAGGAPIISTTSCPAGTVGVAYSTTLAASGGSTPYAWSLASGSLPAGLTLNVSTGAITGTPTTAGTSNVTAKVTDSLAATDTQALTLDIAASGGGGSSDDGGGGGGRHCALSTGSQAGAMLLLIGIVLAGALPRKVRARR